MLPEDLVPPKLQTGNNDQVLSQEPTASSSAQNRPLVEKGENMHPL